MRTFFEKHVWWKRIVLVVGAYLCVLSLARLISFQGNATVYWGGQYFGFNITAVALFGVTVWLFNRFLLRGGRRQSVFSCVGGLLLTLAVVYGAYAHYENDIFRSPVENVQQIFMILGISTLTVPLISELFLFLDKAQDWYVKKVAEEQGGNGRKPEETQECSQSGKKAWWIKFYNRLEKTPALYFLLVWAIIFGSYMPLFLSQWPGNFIYDAKYQIQNVIEGYYFTHHPLIHTLMMGKAYEFGQKFMGSASAGFQFYTLAQMLILTASFAYLLLYLFKKKVPKVVQVCVLLWFALFPMHALFSITATKDVLCAAFFLFFMVFLARMLWDKEAFRWYSYAGMVVSGVLLSLFRNNALYAVLATGVVLAVFIKGWKQKGKLLGLFVCILLFSKLVNEALISYTNAATTDSYRESMSVPLQCLARVGAYREEELSPELYEEICMYITPEVISSYNPYLSDPVKNNAKEELLKENTVNFFKLWLKVGMQFPDEYVESIVTNTLGYWYPLNQGVYVNIDISLYHTLIGLGEEIEKKSFCDWAEKLYNRLFWTNDYRYVPLLGYAFRNAPYIWLLLMYMLWCLHKKEKSGVLLGMLPFLYFGTCLLGPVSALRYVYSIVVCAPLLICLVLEQRHGCFERSRS